MGIFVGDLLTLNSNTQNGVEINEKLTNLATVDQINLTGNSVKDIEDAGSLIITNDNVSYPKNIYVYLMTDQHGHKFRAYGVYGEKFHKICAV